MIVQLRYSMRNAVTFLWNFLHLSVVVLSFNFFIYCSAEKFYLQVCQLWILRNRSLNIKTCFFGKIRLEKVNLFIFFCQRKCHLSKIIFRSVMYLHNLELLRVSISQRPTPTPTGRCIKWRMCTVHYYGQNSEPRAPPPLWNDGIVR